MPMNRKLLGAAAFSLALAGGGVAGAVLGTPSLSGAQDDPTTTTSADAAPDAFGPIEHGPGARLETAAEALGMTEDELLTELRAGKSIAQVAEERDVDVQTVIDALVADATERLQELEASLPDRMTELVNREGLPDRGRPGHPGLRHHLRDEGIEAAAAAIGISEDDLRSALQDGSTIAEVAADHGVDVQAVIDALVADATERIDQAVADGRLDADRAEQMKADLEARITARVNGERPDLPDGPFAPEGTGDAD